MNTPRTDAAVVQYKKDIDWGTFPLEIINESQKLERELTAERERVRELRDVLLDNWYQATGHPDKKRCGHPYHCTCLDKNTRATLEKTK